MNFLFRVFAILLIGGVLISGWIKNPNSRVDLRICYDAALNLINNLPVYKITDALEHTKSPLGTLLFVPLAQLPFRVVSLFWDFLNLFSVCGILWILVKKTNSQSKLNLALGATLFCLNQLTVEFSVGQYNLIALFVILTLVNSPKILTSAGIVFVFLLKPTNIFFLPWLLVERFKKYPKARVSKELAGLAAMGFGWLGFLSLVYFYLFGFHQFVTDFKEWFHFLPVSTAKHIQNPDNLGLPGLLAPYFPLMTNGILIILVGLIATTITSLKVTSTHLSLGLCSLIFLWISPMTWPQNYCLLIPGFIWAFTETTRKKPFYGILVLSLSAYYTLTQVLNYTFLGEENFRTFRTFRPLFWASVLSSSLIAFYFLITRRTKLAKN